MLVLFTTNLLNGHEISNLTYTLNGEEACDENVGFRHIELFTLCISYGCGSNAEKAAFLSIEECTKDAGRVEDGQTAPINRAIFPDERHGIEISNDGIVFNCLIRCRWMIRCLHHGLFYASFLDAVLCANPTINISLHAHNP